MTLAAGQLGSVSDIAPSPDGTTVAVGAHDGRLLLVSVESGEVTELAASDDGDIDEMAWSPDSAWLAWAQPGPQPLSRIRLARVADRFTVDVTDGRFADSDPVFTGDGLYLAFLSRRTFDPVYDAHSFDLSFPFGSRPYLVPLAAQHAVAVRAAAGRPSGQLGGEFKRFFSGTYAGDCRHRSPLVPRDGGPGGRGAGTTAWPRSRAAWSGCGPGCPACSARARRTWTRTARGRRSSGSTCASARRARWPARSTGTR